MISQNIHASNCFTKTSFNNQNNLSFSWNHVLQISFRRMKYHCTTTKEAVTLIRSLKSSNSCGYGEVPLKLLKSCYSFISSPLNYISNRTLFRGVFPDGLKYGTKRPLFKKGNKGDINN